MNAWAFCRSQFRRRSWINTEAEVVACFPGDYLWGSDYQYLGVSHYYIQVCYSANAHEVVAEFRWGTPWGEGDTFSLRFDPANPECNDRTGIWLIRNVLFWVVFGILMIAGMTHNWWIQG
jgi:hypothetical protein